MNLAGLKVLYYIYAYASECTEIYVCVCVRV